MDPVARRLRDPPPGTDALLPRDLRRGQDGRVPPQRLLNREPTYVIHDAGLPDPHRTGSRLVAAHDASISVKTALEIL